MSLMYCTCTAHVLHMYCTCTVHVLHMYCTCTAHYCTCTVHYCTLVHFTSTSFICCIYCLCQIGDAIGQADSKVHMGKVSVCVCVREREGGRGREALQYIILKEYDYLFDIDIDDGGQHMRKLKLPYNKAGNSTCTLPQHKCTCTYCVMYTHSYI